MKGVIIRMENTMPSLCPVCSKRLDITKLTCPACDTEITGCYSPTRYCALDDKMLQFLETFLKSRGNIKEVERTLLISYPTVKGLLDELLRELFPEDGERSTVGYTASEILDKLENNEITADEAAALLTGEARADHPANNNKE